MAGCNLPDLNLARLDLEQVNQGRFSQRFRVAGADNPVRSGDLVQPTQSDTGWFVTPDGLHLQSAPSRRPLAPRRAQLDHTRKGDRDAAMQHSANRRFAFLQKLFRRVYPGRPVVVVRSSVQILQLPTL